MNDNAIFTQIFDADDIFDADRHADHGVVVVRAWHVPSAEDRIADFALVTVHDNRDGEYTEVAWFEDADAAQAAHDADVRFMTDCANDPFYADEQDILIVGVELIQF